MRARHAGMPCGRSERTVRDEGNVVGLVQAWVARRWERKVASTSCSDLYRENATCAFITYMISHPRCWCHPTVYFTIVRKVNAPRLVATTGVRSGFRLVATDNVWNGKSLCHANEKPIRGK